MPFNRVLHFYSDHLCAFFGSLIYIFLSFYVMVSYLLGFESVEEYYRFLPVALLSGNFLELVLDLIIC